MQPNHNYNYNRRIFFDNHNRQYPPSNQFLYNPSTSDNVNQFRYQGQQNNQQYQPPTNQLIGYSIQPLHQPSIPPPPPPLESVSNNSGRNQPNSRQQQLISRFL